MILLNLTGRGGVSRGHAREKSLAPQPKILTALQNQPTNTSFPKYRTKKVRAHLFQATKSTATESALRHGGATGRNEHRDLQYATPIGQASQLPQSASTVWYLIHRPRWPTAVHSHSRVVHIPHLYRSRRSSSACPCLIDSSVYRFRPSIAPSPVLPLSILLERSTNPNSFRLTA